MKDIYPPPDNVWLAWRVFFSLAVPFRRHPPQTRFLSLLLRSVCLFFVLPAVRFFMSGLRAEVK